MSALAERLEFAIREVSLRIQDHEQGLLLPVRGEAVLKEVLVRCLLSSRVPYASAVAAAARLRSRGLLRRPTSQCESAIRAALSEPFVEPQRRWRYRFPNIRARQISWTLRSLDAARTSLTRVLSEYADTASARRQLVRVAAGIGPKQASMFLRDAGRCDRLAIIDAHVLRFLAIRGLVASASAPRSIAQYEEIEERFQSYADSLGVSPARADRAIWVVMRVAQREGIA